VSRDGVAFAIATWFGCGLSPVAPGTVGSLAALPVYFAVRKAGTVAILGTALGIAVAGIWAAGVVAARNRTKDPQFIVVDEVAGVLVALAAAPCSLAGAVGAVVLFRICDVVKPFPARRAERLEGGWGIVLDDVVAGLQAASAMGALRAIGVFR